MTSAERKKTRKAKWIVFLVGLAAVWAYNLLVNPMKDLIETTTASGEYLQEVKIFYQASIKKAGLFSALWLVVWYALSYALPSIFRYYIKSDTEE